MLLIKEHAYQHCDLKVHFGELHSSSFTPCNAPQEKLALLQHLCLQCVGHPGASMRAQSNELHGQVWSFSGTVEPTTRQSASLSQGKILYRVGAAYSRVKSLE